MKKKSEPRPRNPLLWWTVVLVIFIGCLTPKKAKKAIEKFPEVAEGVLLNGLQRITVHDTVINTVVDSSGFLESRSKALSEAERQRRYTDSLWKTLPKNNSAKQICADILLINDALVQENKTLNRLIANVRPIVKTVTLERRYEDTLKSILLTNQLVRTKDTLSKVRSELKVYKDRAKGNFTLYFPKWLLWLIIIGAVVYFGVKNKTLIGKLIKSVK